MGSATKRLKDVPQIEARLWRTLQQHNFENGIAAANLTVDEILLRLDYPSYFDLLNQPLPDGNTNILDAIARDRLINAFRRWGLGHYEFGRDTFGAGFT